MRRLILTLVALLCAAPSVAQVGGVSYLPNGCALLPGPTIQCLNFSGNKAASFAVGPGAGTGATIACATNHVCTNVSGEITLTTGTSPTTGAGTIVYTVTLYSTAQTAYPNCTVQAYNANGLSTVAYESGTSTGFVRKLFGSSGAAASTVYTIDYVCM